MFFGPARQSNTVVNESQHGASDCGCAGRLLPGPNRITWLSGVIYLTGMGPEKHRTYTKHLTLLCLFLHASDYCSLTYGGKNDDRDLRNEIVENPCVRLSSVPPLQRISQLTDDNRPIVQGGMQW